MKERMIDHSFIQIGGGNRIRTDDILLAKQALYQLSYTPLLFEGGGYFKSRKS